MESSDAPVRVVVADDHPFYRDGVSRGLTHSGRITVVAEVGDGRETLDVIRRERPDVALVDYEMPDVDGLGVVRAVVRAPDPVLARAGDPVDPTDPNGRGNGRKHLLAALEASLRRLRTDYVDR